MSQIDLILNFWWN